MAVAIKLPTRSTGITELGSETGTFADESSSLEKLRWDQKNRSMRLSEWEKLKLKNYESGFLFYSKLVLS